MHKLNIKGLLSARHKFLFCSKPPKHDKLDGVNESNLGNNKGIVYNLRKDSKVSQA